MRRFGLVCLVAVMLSTTPALWVRAQEVSSGEAVKHSGESCVYAQQQRKDTCKKSAVTCTDVHRLDALNLIKDCAQLAQDCDLLGTRVEDTCQPGGNGQVTLQR
jgi:hypothetical protein